MAVRLADGQVQRPDRPFVLPGQFEGIGRREFVVQVGRQIGVARPRRAESQGDVVGVTRAGRDGPLQVRSEQRPVRRGADRDRADQQTRPSRESDGERAADVIVADGQSPRAIVGEFDRRVSDVRPLIDVVADPALRRLWEFHLQQLDLDPAQNGGGRVTDADRHVETATGCGIPAGDDAPGVRLGQRLRAGINFAWTGAVAPAELPPLASVSVAFWTRSAPSESRSTSLYRSTVTPAGPFFSLNLRDGRRGLEHGGVSITPDQGEETRRRVCKMRRPYSLLHLYPYAKVAL